jgi:hypothetical protein
MGKGTGDFERLLAFMPEGWEAKAKELGALQRLGGDIQLNKIGVYKRIRSSAEWLKWLCVNFCRNSGLLADKPQWLKEIHVCLVDASEDPVNNKSDGYAGKINPGSYPLETG